MTDHRARVDELLAGYRRSREHLADTHRELSAISATVSSADGSVTVTVGPRGTVTDLTLSDDAYRTYRPPELAKEIVRLTAMATVRALSDAGEVLAPALPAGTDPQALLLGTADLDPVEIAPESSGQAPGDPGADEDEDFESASWLTDGWSRSR
ncbi:MAG: YbaB/EbfC family nucleoid-associated protein [Haloechinothrix sp.]